VGTVAVTQSAEAVPMHAATAMQTVSTPIIRLFAVIISYSCLAVNSLLTADGSRAKPAAAASGRTAAWLLL
jgi:hypothetical protein